MESSQTFCIIFPIFLSPNLHGNFDLISNLIHNRIKPLKNVVVTQSLCASRDAIEHT